ncbi:hypothetical protein ACIQUB_13790, partial [Rhizobium sp. NPDC090275]|uniref:hypothetical protein n=1 Tax=Rhizobium sp. NPDC090275 TaxID=3364498 RepID=UPI00383B1E52
SRLLMFILTSNSKFQSDPGFRRFGSVPCPVTAFQEVGRSTATKRPTAHKLVVPIAVMATSPVSIALIVVAIFSDISVAVIARLGALGMFCTAPRFAVAHIRVTS